ncbi:hypothetical protein FSP39_021667 [Pinctada imbricata]|uniref:Uncharacterized protein n=1 Tax=Pinctada imbricata TaxID=66713 RepID=A0AA89C0S3_PINIB|nr:hypothetical protein FSP39_021667 [Pinctada imbricata]
MVLSMIGFLQLVQADWPCLFAKPCVCDYNYRSVYCTNQGLTGIPPYINFIDGMWSMDFSNNNLTHLPKDSFGNISLNTLKLSNNNLKTIEDGALKSSETSMFTLSLDGNMLETLPKEVGKLPGLYELHLDDNPMKSFDADVLGKLGRLSTFSFGSPQMTQWPTVVNKLSNLSDLTIRNSAIETIPDDAFLLLKNVYTLTLTSTSVRALPSSLQNTRIFILTLNDNKNLHADGFPPAAFKHQTELRQFYINDGALETLPPIFTEMSVLAICSLTNTPLRYINESVFPKNFSNIFNEFDSDNSLFESVPHILSKVNSLSTIKLTNNKITYINETDFSGNSKLFWLHLSGNPITGISDDAFKHNPTLYYLYLDNTELTTIKNIHKLSSLDLTNTKIQCTCNALDWMKYWKPPKSFNILGGCLNNEMTLSDYVKYVIPKC